ncbi:hypothetical protein [Erwinia mallotivora]|uniref:hypothetical protein n=1 Tax=Erwinia mallotivora TaxID=69222 RepID=UPI0021C0C2DE|nr:hypothetical protein [Erwinia mallotivora]
MNCKKENDKDGSAWLSKTHSLLDVFTKLIPIVIFFLLASGSFHILLFTKKHGVRFVDLLQSNFIIAFSGIFLFSSIVLTISFSILITLNVVFKHGYINFFSSRMCASLNKVTIFKISLFYFIFSFWPALIKQSVIIAFAYPVLILTVYFLFKREKKHVFGSFLIIQSLAFLNILVVMIAIYIISYVYGDILNKTSDDTVIKFVCVFHFLILMTVFIPWGG